MTPLASFIAACEGCKLKSYQDQKGVWTIGYGATGEGIGPGTVWSQKEAEERFSKDLAKFEAGVVALVTAPINEKQKIALTSFAYNVGLHNFARSGLLKFLNREEYHKAADQFLLWNHVGAYVSAGLTNRRKKERELFLS